MRWDKFRFDESKLLILKVLDCLLATGRILAGTAHRVEHASMRPLSDCSMGIKAVQVSCEIAEQPSGDEAIEAAENVFSWRALVHLETNHS